MVESGMKWVWKNDKKKKFLKAYLRVSFKKANFILSIVPPFSFDI